MVAVAAAGAIALFEKWTIDGGVVRKVERLPRGIVEGGGCGVGDVAGMVFPTKVDTQLFASGNKGWHEG